MQILLIEYFQKKAEELAEIEKQLQTLKKELRKFYNTEIKNEIKAQQKILKEKRATVTDYIVKSIHELRFLKKNFPELFNIILEDKYLKPIIEKKLWLLDFKPLKPKEADTELKNIKTKRKQLKEIKEFLKKWSGKIDAPSLIATWDVLKGEIKGKLERDEVFQKIDEIDRKYKRNGWLVIVNEPLINKQLEKFLMKIKQIELEEKEAIKNFNKTTGKGTTIEYAAQNELNKIQKKKNAIEKKCTNMIFANTEFAIKIRKDRLFRSANKGLAKVLDDVLLDGANEDEWIKKMKKKLGEINDISTSHET